MNFERETTMIYGLFIGSDCIYVGQSVDVLIRERQHRKGKTFDALHVFRHCRMAEAGRIEQQIIAAYIGHYLCRCKLGIAVFVPSVNKSFISKGQAARHLGYNSAAAMWHDVKRGDLQLIPI
jgi:hypothetical protein